MSSRHWPNYPLNINQLLMTQLLKFRVFAVIGDSLPPARQILIDPWPVQGESVPRGPRLTTSAPTGPGRPQPDSCPGPPIPGFMKEFLIFWAEKKRLKILMLGGG